VDSEAKRTDWVNLPDGARTVSLWNALHDGELHAVHSDRRARTVTLEFDVDYVRTFNHLPEGTKFLLVLHGVQSVRATSSEPWPGDFAVPKGAPREEESRLITEYQAKWREESQSWSEFERSIAGAETLDATLVEGDNVVALKITLSTAHDRYYEMYTRADSIAFAAGARHLSLGEFIRLGEAYWEAFSRRARPKPE
jgi:hypothetical protein